MLLNLLFIIIGALTLYYLYSNTIQNFENYSSNKMYELKQYFYDNAGDNINEVNDFLTEYDKIYKRNIQDKKHEASLYETIDQNFALLHAMKILKHVNNHTENAINLYNVCYKNGDPCNPTCKQLNPNFCKIAKYNSSN